MHFKDLFITELNILKSMPQVAMTALGREFLAFMKQELQDMANIEKLES